MPKHPKQPVTDFIILITYVAVVATAIYGVICGKWEIATTFLSGALVILGYVTARKAK